MIIKEEDVVITHFGVQGMRWGVRKERYEQNREKAKNILKDPKEIAKLALNIAKKTATSTLLNEVSSTSSLRRYDKSGAKDISRKQYKKHSLTPEIAVSRGIKLGMAVAPFVKTFGGVTVHTLAEYKRQRQAAVDARMKSWGPNLLDKKTSEFHTIYDDSYMSVLERIKKG